MSHTERIEWLWKTDNDPWSNPGTPSDSTEWCCFSDVEALLLEEAFQRNESEVLLDENHIDLKRFIQISNNDMRRQRPIKRVMGGSQKLVLRKERFMLSPFSPSEPFADYTYTWGGHFCHEASEYLHCNIYDVHTNNSVRRTVVEKAADGLITEGKNVGKQREAEWMAQQLLNVKNKTSQDVWCCCARLYTLESFLYKKLNEVMRLQEDETHKTLWRNKVSTFGPFALLLCVPEHGCKNPPQFVYRSAQLTDDHIEQFQTMVECGGRFSFPAFTSTSRNRTKAEFMDGNVFFIIEIPTDNFDFITFDLSPYSNFDEEEQLLSPTDGFTVAYCKLDATKNKWEIYLTPDDLS